MSANAHRTNQLLVESHGEVRPVYSRVQERAARFLDEYHQVRFDIEGPNSS